MVLEKSCGAIVYTIENEEIEYLIVEEISGSHSFPKGHMENEETEEETALREIREETDLEVELFTAFRVSEQYDPAEKPGVTKQVIYFLAKYSGQKPRVVRPNEVRALISLRLEDALKIMEHEKEFLKQADDYIKNRSVKQSDRD
ncbi:NUDIX domain-containing protein [Ruminococcus albus]|uniref:NUDIX domain-containing protein n=1 Tax=Ruminococcus albus TaxID=1264 RepID=A0A1H7I6J5_RUMAL|nr:NUDIX domain-containing protein [Ruminococcus albus]SEK57090.1 NUDIX domain-containing protein [Ruminococcus albus]